MLYRNVRCEFDRKALAVSVERARKAFYVGPLSRIGIRDVPYKTGTSAGFGYSGTKGEDGNWDKAVKIADGLLSGGQVCRTPCVAYARGHFGTSDEPKTRLVWGFPFHQTLIEGMYAQPLIKAYLSSTRHPMVFGHTSSYIGAKMNEARLSGFVQMTDFSRFDASIQPFLLGIAFDVLFANFPNMDPVHRNLIEKYFVTTPIQFADGERYLKYTGVPSGSYFTQLVDSVVSFIVAHYALLRQGVNPDLVLVLGDDSLVATKSAVDIESYQSAVSELGISISQDKSKWNSSKEVHFLGHYLSNNGALSRPFIETLDRLVFVERPRDFTFGESIARCLGHYVDSGDPRALALAYRLHWRALQRRPSEVTQRDVWYVRGTGWQEWVGPIGENLFAFEPGLLLEH